MDKPAPVPAEIRARLRELRDAALIARLTDAVSCVDSPLVQVATEACYELETALAKVKATLPLAELPIAAAKGPLPGAKPAASARGVLSRLHRQPSRPERKPTGPDRWDEEIPY